MDKQIYVEGNLIHPETNSGVVTHNNSNLKNFLNGLVSTDNMPAFMQNFLQSQNYVQANQALKTNPETYFDEAFNSWSGVNSPVVSGGNCTFNGSNQYLTCTPGWTLGTADFSVELKFNITAFSSGAQLFTACNGTSGNLIAALIYTDGIPRFSWRPSSGTTQYHLIGTTVVSTDENHVLEINFDASTNTRRLFLDGQLENSDTQAMNANKIMKLGINVSNSVYYNGSIDYVRISDCVRHTSSYTPQTPSFDDNTLSLLLFD